MSIFMKQVHVSTDIDASPATVWNILLAFESYPDWNPMLVQVDTVPEPGAPVRFTVAQANGKALRLKAEITRLDSERELVWKGGSNLLLSGEHYFRLQCLPGGGCRFEHGEYFRGALLPLVRRLLRDSEALYQSMNQALKSRAESCTVIS